MQNASPIYLMPTTWYGIYEEHLKEDDRSKELREDLTSYDHLVVLVTGESPLARALSDFTWWTENFVWL